ncbi:hypothetical protein D3C72_1715600 [compost metagenome]
MVGKTAARQPHREGVLTCFDEAQFRHMAVVEGFRTAINDKNNRRFQALGGVHGHDAHFAAILVLLALHFRRIGFQNGQKGLQAGQAGSFVIQRKGQELIQNVARLVAKPAEEFFAPVMQGQDRCKEIMHRGRFRKRDEAFQFGGNGGKVTILFLRKDLQPFPDAFRFRSRGGNVENVIFCQVEERAFQKCGE